MVFRYRYVDFGTIFSPQRGVRAVTEGDKSRTALYENELAVDVGGVCWGYADEQQSIIDHHFYRPGQFPSASAAVLHNAIRIREKFRESTAEVVWLVTHRETDFDAFCSMYLVRSILEDSNVPIDWESLGLSAEGWFDVPAKNAEVPAIRKINWFDPDLTRIPLDQRWRVLMATYASLVDNSRRLRCRKSRALHSVLYAALTRGREYLSEESGASEFFEHAKEAVQTKALNPLYDSVLEDDPAFSPELVMLDHEVEAYDRDIQRSRKVVVHIQQTAGQFKDLFPGLRALPLLDAELATRSEHLIPTDQTRSQTDGVYIRDPECLLFKEWARMDTENSSMGSGFLFTAVAYSNGRPDGQMNQSDYFFAIDPERAGGRHLYGVWARLQSAEIRALNKPEHKAFRLALEQAEVRTSSTLKRTNCRPGFEDRAGQLKGLFDDPWFDGSNYECTIVATPNRGTLLGEAGLRSDLLDDPVAAIVQTELEYSIYSSSAFMVDLPASQEHAEVNEKTFEMAGAATLGSPPTGHFRLGHVQLHTAVNLVAGSMAGQVGGALWRILNPDMEGTPTDFFSRHLLINPDWLGVWNRRGVMIAYKEAARDRVVGIEARFRELVTLARDVESFVRTNENPALELVKTGEELTRRAARLEHGLVLPENRLLSRFFGAIQLGDVLNTLRDLNLAAADRVRNEKLDAQTLELTRHTATVADVQTKVEWLEVFFVGFYATELSRIMTDLLGLTRDVALIAIVCVGLVFTLAAAWTLAPWRHGDSKKMVIILLLLVVLWITGLLVRSNLPTSLLERPVSNQVDK